MSRISPRLPVVWFVLAAIAAVSVACEQERAEVREAEQEPPAETAPPTAPAETSAPPAAAGNDEPDPDNTLPPDHPPVAQPSAASGQNASFLREQPLPELTIAVPTPSADAFRKLVTARLEEATGLYVDGWWGARLGGPDAEPAWIARLCIDADDAWHHNWFLVLTSTGSEHVVPFRAQSRAVCRGETGEKRGLDQALDVRDETFLELFDSDLYGSFHKQHIVERDGRLVVAREAASPGAGPTGTEVHETRFDWEHGWFEERVRAVMAGDPTTPRTDDIVFDDVPSQDVPRAGALIRIEREPTSTDPTWTRASGELAEGDASLQVLAVAETTPGASATAKPETAIELSLALQDDTPTDKDRVEVSWCTDASRCTTTGARTLLILPNTGDEPTTGWLESDKSPAPPPVTRDEAGRLVLRLPLVALAASDAPVTSTPQARSYPLTVRFLDDDGDGDATRVSTAMIDSAPSRLVALPTLTRLPLAGRPLAAGDPIVTSSPAEQDDE